MVIKRGLFVGLTAVFALLLTACATAAPPDTSGTPQFHGLPNLGQAPELENDIWINADAPVTLAAQRGKVVLLEFWTFG